MKIPVAISIAGLLSFPVRGSAAQTIYAMGQKIEVENAEFYAGSADISNFNVLSPVSISLPRGNSVLARDLVFLYQNNKLKLVSSPESQDLVWVTPAGLKVNLDCGKRPATPTIPEAARLISFYPNQEYKSGCALREPLAFVDASGDQLTVRGDLETTPNFGLAYAQKLVSGSLTIGEDKVELLADKEIAFFPSGRPNFFTLRLGQSFTVENPTYGKLRFGQIASHDVATTLYDNGQVERGILAQDLVHKPTGLPIPANSAVVFSDDAKTILGVMYQKPVVVAAKNFNLTASRFLFNARDFSLTLTVAEGFTFTNPQGGATIDVPAGSEVKLSRAGDVLSIQVPKARE